MAYWLRTVITSVAQVTVVIGYDPWPRKLKKKKERKEGRRRKKGRKEGKKDFYPGQPSK